MTLKVSVKSPIGKRELDSQKGKIDRVFNILEEHESIRLMSLFERKIPLSRKYYKRPANEMHLIIEKNFVEVFIQVKEILSMTTDFPHYSWFSRMFISMLPNENYAYGPNSFEY